MTPHNGTQMNTLQLMLQAQIRKYIDKLRTEKQYRQADKRCYCTKEMIKTSLNKRLAPAAIRCFAEKHSTVGQCSLALSPIIKTTWKYQIY